MRIAVAVVSEPARLWFGEKGGGLVIVFFWGLFVCLFVGDGLLG